MSRLAFYKKGGKYYAKNTPVTRYWKNNDTTFTRPNLTTKGTLGGSSFAVASSIAGYNSNYEIWKAFDGDIEAKYQSVSNTSIAWITFYNPKPLNVKSITYYQEHGERYYYIRNMTIQGSNDNTNWTNIGTYTATAWVDNFTVDMNSNTGFYKYHRLYITNRSYFSNQNAYLICRELTMVATQRNSIDEVTADDDYDYTTVENHYQIFRKE